MDTRIKDKTKIFGNGDITQAEQNYTGCFGYFANKAEDFNNLENTFYGQFIGTDYSDRRFYTPDPENENEPLKFLMFLPEEFVSDEIAEVSESLEEPPEEIDIPDIPKYPDYLEENPEPYETQDWDYDDFEPVVSETSETQNRIDHIFDKLNSINDRLGLFDYFHFDVEFSALKAKLENLENRISKLEKGE